MRHAYLALFGLILFVGCGDDESAARKVTESTYALDERTIHAFDEKTFAADGKKYTLVRVEYGDTEDCDLFDDCSYSTYCGFVVDGDEYPLSYNFVTDEDALFDEDDVEMTGYDLAIFDDEDFDEWLWETDSEDEILIECFE